MREDYRHYVTGQSASERTHWHAQIYVTKKTADNRNWATGAGEGGENTEQGICSICNKEKE